MNARFLNYPRAGLMKRMIQATKNNLDAIAEHVGAQILNQSQYQFQEGKICWLT